MVELIAYALKLITQIFEASWTARQEAKARKEKWEMSQALFVAIATEALKNFMSDLKTDNEKAKSVDEQMDEQEKNKKA